MPPIDEYSFKDEDLNAPQQDDAWAQLEAASQQPESDSTGSDSYAFAYVRPTPMTRFTKNVGAAGGIFKGLSGDSQITVAVLLVTAVFCLVAVFTPVAGLAAIAIFPIAAIVFFFIGLIVLTAKAMRSSGEMSLPWGDLALIGVQILMAIVFKVRLPGRLMGIGRGGRGDLGGFYGKVVRLFLKSIFIALCGGLVFFVAVKSNPDFIHRTPPHNFDPDSSSRFNRPTFNAPGDTPGWPPPSHAPATPPEFHAPFMSPVGTPPTQQDFVLQSKTIQHLQEISTAIRIYGFHHRPATPPDLDALLIRNQVADPLVSPYDESLGRNGYVYFPDNVGIEKDRIILYDAGELAKTGSTHVLKGGYQQIMKMTRKQLASQPGVTGL